MKISNGFNCYLCADFCCPRRLESHYCLEIEVNEIIKNSYGVVRKSVFLEQYC